MSVKDGSHTSRVGVTPVRGGSRTRRGGSHTSRGGRHTSRGGSHTTQGPESYQSGVGVISVRGWESCQSVGNHTSQGRESCQSGEGAIPVRGGSHTGQGRKPYRSGEGVIPVRGGSHTGQGGSHTSHLTLSLPVATLPDALRYRVSTRTGRLGVSIVWPDGMACLMRNISRGKTCTVCLTATPWGSGCCLLLCLKMSTAFKFFFFF